MRRGATGGLRGGWGGGLTTAITVTDEAAKRKKKDKKREPEIHQQPQQHQYSNIKSHEGDGRNNAHNIRGKISIPNYQHPS